LVNHLIREVGLYPYLDPRTAAWQERFVFESFKVNVGANEPLTFHREQSLVLKYLLDGDNLAISAPTSFGKSLIIDAFIAIKNPANVLIIVPTIALADETRRRICNKFSDSYRVITTTDVDLAERNILIFPQERAIHYSDKLASLDLFVVDEFYKASTDFDKERSPALLKAMMRFSEIATQRYYLAPNISRLKGNSFTNGMRFLPLDFNTVFLKRHELCGTGNKADRKKQKEEHFLTILGTATGKTLIYAGAYAQVETVSQLILDNSPTATTPILDDFGDWLSKHYEPTWSLVALTKKRTGIHTGRLHRSLSQIQVKLFEEDAGLTRLISTSSIIEGVNTSAENIVLWSNKNGVPLLNDFTYRNIIGRGGRMFKHFVGEIYILEKPPEESEIQLDISLPDALLADIDEAEYKQELTKEQLAKIILYREEMAALLGKNVFERLRSNKSLMTGDIDVIIAIAKEISGNRNKWHGLAALNSERVEHWGWVLMQVIRLTPADWDCGHKKLVEFVKTLSGNWDYSIPELLGLHGTTKIDISDFFTLERTATFKLPALLHDINTIQREVLRDKPFDISPFIAKLSKAFLPSCVFELEEYGLPRMLAKKLHHAGFINFKDESLDLHSALARLASARPRILLAAGIFDRFDRYVLRYFFDGFTRSNDA